VVACRWRVDLTSPVVALLSKPGVFVCIFVCVQVSKTGQVLLSEIVGAVKMRVRLTGMPELRLGLNDKVLFENTNSEWMSRAGRLGGAVVARMRLGVYKKLRNVLAKKMTVFAKMTFL